MKLQTATHGKKARIEIIPLIDVIFFLLATMVLIAVTLQKVEGQKVDLPKAATAVAAFDTEVVTVTLTEIGAIYWNDRSVNWNEYLLSVQAYARDEIAAGKEKPKIQANFHRGADFGQAANILDEARKAGIVNVAIQTTPTGARRD